jgi:subtilase family serine protease
LPAGASSQLVGPPYSGYAYETPASLACIYHLVAVVAGCNPNTFKTNPTGGSKAIGIVDAYDYPTAMADLNIFAAQFGLPAVTATTFKKIYAGGTDGCSGTKPANNAGWEGEEALDIEMAHGMAPKATIFLVEAQTNSFTDLLVAEDCAGKKVAAAGGGEVSNSWGGGEFSGETTYDSHFKVGKVVYFASTGDAAGTIWPSTSTNVVAVGGTTTSRVNTVSGSKMTPATFGNFIGESAWEEGGGGLSLYEPRPAYQKSLPAAAHKVVPDVSSDANPNTGVWVYDANATTGVGWYVFGGTSVSSPTWAGIVNRAGGFATSTPAELTKIYTAYATATSYAADFNDIAYGLCGFYDGYQAVAKWDPCTGVGSPRTYAGK